MQDIVNYTVYTSGMDKSYADKLFFMDKVSDSITGIVDYGCADGALLNRIKNDVSDAKLVGFDVNEEMINLAKKKGGCLFTTDYELVLNSVDVKKSLLNISSVIHEVYSYSGLSGINKFWNNVFASNFQYISIRDFCVSSSINRDADINDYTKVIRKANLEQIRDFESVWGSLRENRNLVHYLMKYRYLENWEREVRENYFPISLENLLSKIPTEEYEIIYFEDYVLPFTANKIYDDFGIRIHDNTHVKLLLKRKRDVTVAA